LRFIGNPPLRFYALTDGIHQVLSQKHPAHRPKPGDGHARWLGKTKKNRGDPE
jgi:hypothetical protein